MLMVSDKKKKFLIIDIILMILMVALDQFTKYLAVINLQNKAPFVILDGILELNFLKNFGAAFGMLQNQKIIFLIIAVLILIIIAYVIFKLPDDKKYDILNYVLVFIAAGAIGNMIDRIRHEYVVDFIYFVLINFPIFNVADIYVTVATFMFIFLFLFYYKENDFDFISFKKKK